MNYTTTIEKTEPRIYVACLSAYNNGYLHGAWIDAGQETWDIWAAIEKMLRASPMPDAEEYAIHDYEGFEGIRISESEGIEQVRGVAAFVTEHGTLGAAIYNDLGGYLDEAREAMTDRYLGCYASLADYMEEVTEDSITIPQPLAYYIDWEAMGRDAELNGDVATVRTAHDEVHVFAGC